MIELGPLAVDIARATIAGFPNEQLQAAIDRLAAADAIIAATPVYKAGISGLFKSFVDVLDNDLLVAKPVLLAATGGSARHALVIDDQMRPLFAYLRALTLPTSIYAAPEDWGATELGDRIERAATELAVLLRAGIEAADRRPRLVELPAPVRRQRHPRRAHRLRRRLRLPAHATRRRRQAGPGPSRGRVNHSPTNDHGDQKMRIAVVGRGNVGGGLADLWERTGHRVTRLGRDGGDVSDAEVVLVAVPGGAIAEALDRVTGLEGKTVIDATNLYGVVPPNGFASNAEFVKSKTNGPTAKSFNINFASLYGRLGEARVRPSNLWCGDEAAREVVEQLNRDAGYDPVYTGPIENAAAQEALVGVIFAINEAMGPYVYRFAPLESL